jgi:hypothetical protein
MVYDDLPMKHGGFFDGKTLNDQSHWIGLRAPNFNGKKKHDFRVRFYKQNQSNDQRVLVTSKVPLEPQLPMKPLPWHLC